MNSEMLSRIILGAFAVLGVMAIIAYVLKDIFFACWSCLRENTVTPAERPQEQVIEMQPTVHENAPNVSNIEEQEHLPTYEEATSGQPRRRRISPKENMTTGNIGRDETDTQLASGEATGTSTLNTGDDSGVKLDVDDNSGLNSSRDGGNTSTASNVRVKSVRFADSVGKEVERVSKYKTTGEASGSGRK